MTFSICRLLLVVVPAFVSLLPPRAQAAPDLMASQAPATTDPTKFAAKFNDAKELAHSDQGRAYMKAATPLINHLLVTAVHTYQENQRAHGRYVPAFYIPMVLVLAPDGHIQGMLYDDERTELKPAVYAQRQGYLGFVRLLLPSIRFRPPPQPGWLLPVIFRSF